MVIVTHYQPHDQPKSIQLDEPITGELEQIRRDLEKKYGRVHLTYTDRPDIKPSNLESL
jgi:hypothetical protein